jgi:hypothetical protein
VPAHRLLDFRYRGTTFGDRRCGGLAALERCRPLPRRLAGLGEVTPELLVDAIDEQRFAPRQRHRLTCRHVERPGQRIAAREIDR